MKQQAKKGGSKEGGEGGRCALNLVDFCIPSAALPPLSFLPWLDPLPQVWTILEMKVFLLEFFKKKFVSIFHPISYLLTIHGGLGQNRWWTQLRIESLLSQWMQLSFSFFSKAFWILVLSNVFPNSPSLCPRSFAQCCRLWNAI
jgi:hypothetical protein